MASTVIRTLILYFFLIAVLRLMGKRQIGELEPAELVTTLFLSELAAGPVVNGNLPLLSSLIPILLIGAIEVILSVIIYRKPKLKRLFCGRPSVLIQNGMIQQRELCRSRIAVEELLLALRSKGFRSPSEISYAILEENGTVSVFPNAQTEPLTPKSINAPTRETGIYHTLICDGVINEAAFARTGKDAVWLAHSLKKHGVCDCKEVFLYAINDTGEEFFARKEKQKGI